LFHPTIAELERPLAKEAVNAVAGATAGANAAASAAAAKGKAEELKEDNKYSGSATAKSAMDAVVKAAEDASNKPGATTDSVAKAAQAAANDATRAAKAKLSFAGFRLEAAHEGAWGANLRASVDTERISDEVALALGVSKAELFNLTVRDAAPGGKTERFINLTAVESARRIDRVLIEESTLVHWDGTLDPSSPPAISKASDAVTDKEDALADKNKDLNKKLINGAPQAEIETARQAVTSAETEVEDEKKKMIDAVSDGLHLKATDFLPANGETNKRVFVKSCG
jgi:hypothetical protein